MESIKKIDISEYPLCDTDFWINISQLLENERVFECFNKVLFADAVSYELINKSFSADKKFKEAYLKYKEEVSNNRAYDLILSENLFINSKERLVIKKLLVENNIEYDDCNKCYKGRPKDLGEKVSIIYATVLSLKILLSDDRGSKKFKNRINNMRGRRGREVAVISTGTFLRRAGLEEKKVGKMLDELYKEESVPVIESKKDDVKKESFLEAKKRLTSSGKL